MAYLLIKILAGEVICEFHGQLYSREALPQPYDSVEDHYIQIGANLYMGPSGEVDDFLIILVTPTPV